MQELSNTLVCGAIALMVTELCADLSKKRLNLTLKPLVP